MTTNDLERDICRWRISVGMQQREVWAEEPFSAAHKCGLGSGDLLSAELELLECREGAIDGGYRNLIGSRVTFS